MASFDWAIIDFAEERIVNGAETGARIAEMRLWVALPSAFPANPYHRAAVIGDLDMFIDDEKEIGWPEWPTIRAIQALRSVVAA
jgi:hypothetical protein